MQLTVSTVEYSNGCLVIRLMDKVYFYPRSVPITIAGLCFKGYMNIDSTISVPDVNKNQYERINDNLERGNDNILVDNYDLRVVHQSKIKNLERVMGVKISSAIRCVEKNNGQPFIALCEVAPGITFWYYTLEGHIMVNYKSSYDILDVNAVANMFCEPLSDYQYYMNSARLAQTSYKKIRMINSIRL